MNQETTPGGERRLNEVLAAYLQAADAGHRPDPQELLARHPDLADELAVFLSNQGRMEALAARPDAGATVAPDGPCGPGPLVRYVGDYEILKELARGGMGVVYQARQLSLNRVIALKMILAGNLASEADVRRFHAEAEAVANLEHPNIIPVYEVGTHQGQHYFSMKLVSGGSLGDHIAEAVKDPRAAARLLAVVARAVHHAHQRGIFHRDLKPANILLEFPDPPAPSAAGKLAAAIPMVTDFGLAKRSAVPGGMTQTGVIVGTPSYMAPEQAAAKKDLTTAVDVYSLGAILYEMLTGRPPFQAASALDILQQVLTEEPVPPARLRHGLPRDLETVCLKCLEKDSGRRYGSAQELADDLDRFLAGQPVRARPVRGLERAAKWARRHPAQAAVYGLVLLVVVLGLGGGGAIWLWQVADSARREALAAQEATAQARDQLAVALQAETEAKRHEMTAKHALEKAHDLLGRLAYASGAGVLQSELTAGHYLLAKQRLLELDAAHRGWEWFYWKRTLFPDPLAVLDHPGFVHAVAFSPDGASLACAGDDGTVKVWDAHTGKSLLTLKGHTGPVKGVAFSPDGAGLAGAGDDGAVLVWAVGTGQRLHTLSHAAPVHGVAFSPDGKHLATGDDNTTVTLWDAHTGKKVRTLKGHSSPVRSVAFSPDGRRLVSAAGDSLVKLWDAHTGLALHTLQGHTQGVFSVAFSPDGSRLASASDDRTIKVWDANTGVELRTLKGHHHLLNSVAFSPDGTCLASADLDQTVKLWDANTGEELRLLPGHSAVFSPDGTCLASAGADDTVRLWDVRTGRPLIVRGNETLTGPTFGPAGPRVACVTGDKAVTLWDAHTGKAVHTLAHADAITGAAFSSDGTCLACAGQGKTVTLWDTGTGKQLRILAGHPEPVTRLVFSPDGTCLACVSTDQTLTLWKVHTGQALHTLRGHTLPVTRLAFSPDGSRLASGGGFDKAVKLWHVPTGQELCTLHHADPVDSLAFSPDGARLASGGGQTLKLWDAHTGQALRTLSSGIPVFGVAFSPDSRCLAAALGDRTVRLWDVPTGKALRALKGHTDCVHGVAFSPDGTRLASAGDDKTVKLWDPEAGQHLLTLSGHTGAVWSVAFSPDGSGLASTSLGHAGAGFAAGGLKDTVTVRIWYSNESAQDKENGRAAWRELQAARSEQDRHWFAAAFHLSYLIAEQPKSATLLTRRGRAYAEQGFWDKARADFGAAGQLYPGNAWHQYRCGLALLAKEYKASALAAAAGLVPAPLSQGVLGTTAQLFPGRLDLPPPGFAKSCRQLCEQFGQPLQKKVKLESGEATTAAAVVHLAVTIPVPSHQAPFLVKLAEKAVQSDPHNRTHLETLGAACYRAGEFRAALESFSTAAEKSEKGGPTVEACFYLALAHQRLGQVTEARTWLDQALELMQSRQQSDTPEALSWEDRVRLECLTQETLTVLGPHA